MIKKKTWQVRVYRKVEGWVNVQADTAHEAELKAMGLPNVLSVFGKSAIRGDRPVGQVVAQGVEDDLDD